MAALTFFHELSSLLSSRYTLVISTAFLVYLAVVHGLRYQRLRTILHQHPSLTDLSLSSAFAVHNSLIELEFPSIFSLATTFALFKAYGIPSISALLVQTDQLAGPTLVSSRRYVDTGALLLEAVLNEPGSRRSLEAVARINWLHDRHRSRGRISDEDMLYTLSLFALEPNRWVRKYEWRELSALELCAVGTLWKYLGEALKVSFKGLAGCEKGWGNALEWMRDLEIWSREYEGKYMVPAESNHKLAESTLRIILHKAPSSMIGFGRKTFATVMEEKLREAMIIEKPLPLYYYALSFLINLRKLFLLHLSLPRYRRLSRLPSPSPSTERKFNLARARMHPWYIRPTLKNRWGPSALLKRFKGEVLPGDDKMFMPEGFLTKELGPKGLMGKGQDEMEMDISRLIGKTNAGCPFTGI